VPRLGFRVTSGAPVVWSRAAKSGREIRCAFCPDCGTRLWHEREGATETLSIKGGSLDQPIDLAGAIHIWTSEKLPGAFIPEGALQYPQEPPD
jgi:hypothetical protein